MRRRQQVEPETGVPTILAEGPHVPTWADPGELERLERSDPHGEDRKGAVWSVMLSARRNHGRALRKWAAANGRDPRGLVSDRRPYW